MIIQWITENEIHILLERRNLSQGCHFLDAVRGAGRHTAALAQRGFRVTAVVIFAEIRKEARGAAEAEVSLEWIQID